MYTLSVRNLIGLFILQLDGWDANVLMPAADVCLCLKFPQFTLEQDAGCLAFTNAAQEFPVFTIAARYLYFYRDSLSFHLMSKHI